jgi:transcriptional regulator with XRE-family HTH domain
VRLGKRVRRLRQERGLSQEVAAERAAIDAKHLQAIEGGRANVTFASLVGIARALGVQSLSSSNGGIAYDGLRLRIRDP